MEFFLILLCICIFVYVSWKLLRKPPCTYNSAQAREILNRHCLEVTGKTASTFTIENAPQPEFRNPAPWLQNPKAADPFSNPRYRAYLRAYREIAGDKFYGSGIPLSDGKFLMADKGVMKILLENNLVELNSGTFCLTEKGREFIGMDHAFSHYNN